MSEGEIQRTTAVQRGLRHGGGCEADEGQRRRGATMQWQGGGGDGASTFVSLGDDMVGGRDWRLIYGLTEFG